MDTIKINPSAYFVLIAGILLLASLPFLSEGQIWPWIIAKIFYGFGTLLFVFNK